jgi:signal transduction histidine kinase
LINELIFSKDPQKASLAHGYYTNELGVPVSATGMLVPGPPWGVFVEQPVALLYASIWQRIWFYAGLFLMGLLVSFSLAHFISLRFTKPITRLREGADHIATGQLGYRVAVETSDEIGELANQFNKMAAALNASYQGLEEKIAKRTRELSGLYTAMTPLTAKESLQDLFKSIIERLVSATGSDAAMIRMLDAETQSFVCLAQQGYAAEHVAINPVLASGSADEYVLTLDKPIISGDISSDPRIKRKRQVQFGFRSCAFLPLSVKGEGRGIIHLASRSVGYFTEDKKEYLMAIARLMGIVVENGELLRSSLRYAEELKQSNKELEQFAYVASHDLQEPLRMITGYTKLLAKRYKGKLDQDADDFIRYAVDGAQRMHVLIQDLLTLSRVGTRGKEFAPTDCEVVLSNTLVNLQAAIGDTGATVSHDPMPKVMADAGQLAQVFQNLIGNAIKYQNTNPPLIHVSCQQRSKEWLFSVKDNGIGLDPKYAERIFVIFQRLHTRHEYPGTGIGLALCKKIVERHGGRIWVESEQGRGSIFYFTIPSGTARSAGNDAQAIG